MAAKVKVELSNFYGYLFKPETEQHKGAVVILSDIFGIEQPPVQARATEFAQQGYLTFLPDYLDKDPFTHEKMQSGGMPLLFEWMKGHEPQGEFVQKVAAESVKYVQSEFGFTSKNTFLLGICVGAKALLKAIVTEPLTNTLSGAIIVHGSMMMPAEFAKVEIPTIVLWAENDEHFELKPFLEGIDQVKKEKESTGGEFCGGKDNFQYFVLKDAPHGFWVKTAEPQSSQSEGSNHIFKFLTKFLSN